MCKQKIKIKNGKKLKVETLVDFKYTYMLQFNDFRADQRKEPCIKVNIRKLNKKLYIELSTLYT